jgi:hypothetical protein
MAGEADQTLNVPSEPIIDENKSASGAESDVSAASSSSNAAVMKMADNTIPEMFNYWKRSMITEADHLAYHSVGWLSSGLESLVPEVDIPTIDGSTMVCFESHLVAGLGLPPSKFLIAIMNFLGCELVHQDLNAIAMLNCYTMWCKC